MRDDLPLSFRLMSLQEAGVLNCSARENKTQTKVRAVGVIPIGHKHAFPCVPLTMTRVAKGLGQPKENDALAPTLEKSTQTE